MKVIYDLRFPIAQLVIPAEAGIHTLVILSIAKNLICQIINRQLSFEKARCAIVGVSIFFAAGIRKKAFVLYRILRFDKIISPEID